jgi:hypothetical protein
MESIFVRSACYQRKAGCCVFPELVFSFLCSLGSECSNIYREGVRLFGWKSTIQTRVVSIHGTGPCPLQQCTTLLQLSAYAAHSASPVGNRSKYRRCAFSRHTLTEEDWTRH